MFFGDNFLADIESVGLVCEGGLIAGGSVKCTQRAVYIVKIHNLDHCKASDCDPDGDQVRTICRQCAGFTARRLGELVGEMYSLLPDQWCCPVCQHDADSERCGHCGADITQFVTCASCGKRINSLHDMLQVERL